MIRAAAVRRGGAHRLCERERAGEGEVEGERCVQVPGYLGTEGLTVVNCVAYSTGRLRATSLLFRSASARVRILPMGSSLEWGVRFDREPSNSQHL